MADNPLIKLETEDDIRRSSALFEVERQAGCVAMIERALDQYTAAHDGQLLGDLSELNPHFRHPVDAAIVGRYQ